MHPHLWSGLDLNQKFDIIIAPNASSVCYTSRPQFCIPDSRLLLFYFFYNCLVPMGFLPLEIWVAFPGESQLQQSHATRLTVHSGCFSVSIIHRTLTWTTWSLTCAQMLMHVIAVGGRGVQTHIQVCTTAESKRCSALLQSPAEHGSHPSQDGQV